MDKSVNKASNQYFLLVSLLTSAAIILGIYFLVRYQGLWGETDTAEFARLIRAILISDSLQNAEVVYTNGYGYQSLSLTLLKLSGFEVSTFQLFLSPLLIAWLVLPAWLAYREFTGSGRIASLATMILLVQPEFLFPILRGSHEKFTRGLMFVCLYLLLRSLRSRRELRVFVGFMVAFYISAYALITYNNLMAFSFIFAVGVALALAWLALRFSARQIGAGSSTLQRMILVVLTMLVIAFLFTFYFYPPAQEQLRLMSSVQDRVASLLLEVGDTATNPYAVINYGWTSLPVYLAVSLANWLLLGFSVLVWLRTTYLWIYRRQRRSEQEILLWAFYGAFAFQGALSIVVDVSGAIAANLQHRMFPSFAMLAAPLAAQWLSKWTLERPAHARRTGVLVSVIIVILAVLSTFKATNEPLFSNNWVFYQPAEIEALDWSVANTQNTKIWTDFTGRLRAGYIILHGTPENRSEFDSYTPDLNTSTFVFSDLTSLHSQSLNAPLPIQGDSLRIYDNGQASVYRRRPLTAFQK
jgi:hypothetical protein